MNPERHVSYSIGSIGFREILKIVNSICPRNFEKYPRAVNRLFPYIHNSRNTSRFFKICIYQAILCTTAINKRKSRFFVIFIGWPNNFYLKRFSIIIKSEKCLPLCIGFLRNNNICIKIFNCNFCFFNRYRSAVYILNHLKF